LFEDLEAIAVPTLIIHGIHDQIVPYQLGEVQHRLIQNSSLVPFQYSGHGVFYEQREDFNEVLAKFVRS